MSISSQELKRLLEEIWNRPGVITPKKPTRWKLIRRGRRPNYEMHLRANKKNYLKFFLKSGSHTLDKGR